jgi:4-aminobutyrate aminotransferase-like enzyme
MGATGTFWAHEAWNLPHPPDYVTFAKKMAATGFYHAPANRVSLVCQHQLYEIIIFQGKYMKQDDEYNIK